MSKQGFTAKCACFISPEADEMIRSRFRRKGDYGRLVDEAIKQTYKPKETVVPEVPSNPTAT